MLVNMDDKLKKSNRQILIQHGQINNLDIKIADANHKLERMTKIQELVSHLKTRINNIERGMASDIEKAV